MPTRISRPLTAALLVGAVAATASACSSGSTPSQATSSAAHTPAPAAASTASSTTGPAAEALAAYRAMWADLVAANQTSNYQAPNLPDHLAGQALLTVTDNMAVEKAQGIITLGQPVLHPVVVSASATSVQIQDCVQDSGWLQYLAATHKLLNDIPGGDRSTTATVTDEHGTWKVTQINSEAEGTCHITP